MVLLHSGRRALYCVRGGQIIPHELHIDDERGILELRVSGAVDYQGAQAGRAAAGRVMADSGLTRLLVDIREAIAEAEAAADVVEFHEGHGAVLPPGFRLAVLVAPEPEHQGSHRFNENVAVNRGVPMRTFTDLEEARAWLLT